MKLLSDIAARRAVAKSSGQPDYLQRHAEIVEAAARVFRRKGFPATNLQDIAEELAMDRASLYYYTSGKDELFKDVVAEAVREIVVAVEQLGHQQLPADTKLANLIETLMAAYERHYPYLYVFVQENLTHLDRKTKWNREMISLAQRVDHSVRSIVQQGLDEGSLVSNGGARLLANGIIGMCNWSHRWFHPNEKGDTQLISRAFANMLLNGLRPRNDPPTLGNRLLSR